MSFQSMELILAIAMEFQSSKRNEVTEMKGYYTNSTYMGWIPNKKKYIPFSTEAEYIEYFRENERKEGNLL